MRRVPVLEHENELMLRAIECAHAGVRFGPDAEVLQFEVRVVAGFEYFAEMTPIHADEKDGAVGERGLKRSEEANQKGFEFPHAHLARAHGEFAMSDLPQA